MRFIKKPYFCPKCGIMLESFKTHVYYEFKEHYNVIHRICNKCGEQVISSEKIINNLMYKDTHNK